MSTQPFAKCDEHASWLTRLVPALDWLRHYERKHLPGDALAGHGLRTAGRVAAAGPGQALPDGSAPWHVVSADDKKNARLIISEILLAVFKGSTWPIPNPPRNADESCN